MYHFTVCVSFDELYDSRLSATRKKTRPSTRSKIFCRLTYLMIACCHLTPVHYAKSNEWTFSLFERKKEQFLKTFPNVCVSRPGLTDCVTTPATVPSTTTTASSSEASRSALTPPEFPTSDLQPPPTESLFGSSMTSSFGQT